MKRIIILSVLFPIATTLFAQQQILNGNFEDTTVVHQSSDTFTIFNNWAMSSFGAGTTDDAYSGQKAALIWNWYYYAKGELINGDNVFPNQGGMPVAFRPTNLNGYYKYIYGDNDGAQDSAIAIICLFQYNSSTSKRDTIGYGIKKLGPVSSYTAFTVDVNYSSPTIPDSVVIQFLSSENGFCAVSSAGNCLFLYIDDVTINDGSWSVNVKNNLLPEMNVFPNPAGSHIQVVNVKPETHISVINALGEKVLEEEGKGSENITINVESLPAGIYFLKTAGNTRRFVKR
jgi:hypothetical protein